MFPVSILKGFRRGELSIYTGATGIGKTSLLAQLSLDYAMQGVNTLWGSFEIKNVRLAKKMLTQFAARDLSAATKEDFDRISEQFSQLPLYFLRFFGSTQLEQVLDAMEYAVYAYDVEHVVLDNLQFLLSGQGVGFERFELQDKAIEAFRKFATLKNVHISLVIHPRKQEEDAPLTHASVFGTAKATQEADNVVILQRGRSHKYIEVKKNRFDGELGQIPLRFEKDAAKFYEISPAEIQAAANSAAAAATAKKPAPVAYADRKPKTDGRHMQNFPL